MYISMTMATIRFQAALTSMAARLISIVALASARASYRQFSEAPARSSDLNVYLYDNGNNSFSGGVNFNGGSTHINSSSGLGTGVISPILGGASPVFRSQCISL